MPFFYFFIHFPSLFSFFNSSCCHFVKQHNEKSTLRMYCYMNRFYGATTTEQNALLQ